MFSIDFNLYILIFFPLQKANVFWQLYKLRYELFEVRQFYVCTSG